jgi:hypothetical protein
MLILKIKKIYYFYIFIKNEHLKNKHYCHISFKLDAEIHFHAFPPPIDSDLTHTLVINKKLN